MVAFPCRFQPVQGAARRTGPHFPSGRVAPGITPWRSHRSVRAQLRHTARRVRGSLRTETRRHAARGEALVGGTH